MKTPSTPVLTFPAAGFDCDGNCLDSDEDEVCDDEVEVAPTRMPQLRGRHPDDDGSCIEAILDAQLRGVQRHGRQLRRWLMQFDSCAGCLSSAACNYNGDAIYPGPCEFPEMGYDCEGNCLNDADGDAVCDADEVEDAPMLRGRWSRPQTTTVLVRRLWKAVQT